MVDFNTAYRRLYRHRRIFAYTLYGLVAAVSYVAAHLLRFEFALPPDRAATMLWTLPVLMGVRVALAGTFRLSSGRWRFIATGDVIRLFLATTTGSLILYLANFLAPAGYLVPRSVLLMEWVFTTYATAGVWLSYRVMFERIRHARLPRDRGAARRVLLVGAGEAGNMLAREIQRYPTGYRLVGFVDDDPLKWGCRIQGADVVGGTDTIQHEIRRRNVDEVILAIPSAGPDELRRLVEQLKATEVPFKVLPGIKEVIAGDVAMNKVRELRIEDLLGRDPIQLELPELAEDLGGRCVLITGAAGSIGSELARQVALHGPARLVLLDQAETELFFLELELRESHPDLDLVPVVADIADEAQIERTFARHKPQRVFHAAAYKHVPMMEGNAHEAVKNNVVGTLIVGEASGRHGAGKFVLVSTDKAVRPANVMGSTKRLAELVVLNLQSQYGATDFGAVRFGNVLGSRGSVIPVFRQQLRAGKPLTVTHPDVTRYFMTIPEAVQLILQTSLLPDFRGRVAMLDMGDPVRIVDLAHNFLRLSGLQPRLGENYTFSGLRPGEKLHEELKAPHEGSVVTTIEKVRLLSTYGNGAGLEEPVTMVRRWEAFLGNGHADQVLEELRSLFGGLNGGPGTTHADSSGEGEETHLLIS
jgi:FlaA1/EpsC-like NDP-sugar epimerase